MSYHLIVAVDDKYGIGKNGKIPWDINEDLKHFSKLTKGNGNNAVIMGKNTWLSINSKCLPNRVNIVISKTLKKTKKNGPDYIFNDINDFINYTDQLNIEQYWIIGGQDIYKDFLKLNLCSSCHITKIENNYHCDRYFPIDLCYKNMFLDMVTILPNSLNITTRIFKYVNSDYICSQINNLL